jgi:hypothetical protein
MILKNKIFPVQMPWEKSKQIDERPFTINNDYYNSTGNMEQPFVQISEPFVIAGVKGVVVTIFPFKYNPREDKLVIINSGSIDILLNQAILPVMDKSSALNQYLSSVFVNYEWTSAQTSSKYLIITAPTFEAGMQQFVTHKVSKGFQVDMFNTNVTGTTTTAIKSFIQQRYNDPLTKPEYILLVGDVAQIPAWTGTGAGSPKTDINYAQLEGGDYFADAFLGRFSISTPAELQNAINKSVYMENQIGALTKKNIYMSSTDNWQITEGTHNNVIDQYFGPAAYTNEKLYTYTYGATTQQLINALNDNQIFAIYSGHGGETYWADGPVLYQPQVRDLTNTWYPFVYSFACVTGSYHIEECFGETWLRTDNGASTFYGSSVNSYWDEDDILERRLIKAMFEDGLTRVTPMFDMAKIYLVNHYGGGVTQGSTMLRYLEMYNLMGDPSMPVVEMGPPCPIDPASNPNPVNGATNIPITGNTATWTNGAGTTQIELWFGPAGSLTQAYIGAPITSFALPTLNYATTYSWYVKCWNDTCFSQGPSWSFTTEQDPNLVTNTINIYPQNIDYWTGTCNSSTKTQVSLVNTTGNGFAGWMAFDVTPIINDPTTVIEEIIFNGYLYANNYPYWAITPMGTVNPVTGSASAIFNQVSNNYSQGTAYSYNQESGTLINGWTERTLGTTATTDLKNSLGQGWFAIGVFDWDSGTSYYVHFQGWAEANKPYLTVKYTYTVPVELTSLTATSLQNDVTLKWKTATETNNQGFQVERINSAGSFEKIGYVAGFGTTTEPKSYSFIDSKLEAGNYTYRLKQIDLDGTSTFSDEVNVEVEIPLVYALEQNYPNPFNPSTTIKYSISEDGFVKLAVYNLLGEEVTVLVNNEQKAGRYEVAFDASRFASGVYMYRLESNNFISIKKMVLVK